MREKKGGGRQVCGYRCENKGDTFIHSMVRVQASPVVFSSLSEKRVTH